jgi:hypothetical protein
MAKGSEAGNSAARPKFKRVRQVTVGTLKLVNDQELFLKILTPMTTSAQVRKNADGTLEKPATVVRALDLSTGEDVQVVVPTVLQSNLNTHFPNDSYVGKAFSITMHAQATGKRYRTVDVWEIEPEQ